MKQITDVWGKIWLINPSCIQYIQIENRYTMNRQQAFYWVEMKVEGLEELILLVRFNPENSGRLQAENYLKELKNDLISNTIK